MQMTSSSEEEEEDVPRVSAFFIYYSNRFMNNLPPFTGQIVVIFCVLPVTISLALFLITSVVNFGVAFVAQTISTVAILLFLIPVLALSLVSAVATAHLLQLGQTVYLRIFPAPPLVRKISTKSIDFEEKLKTL